MFKDNEFIKDLNTIGVVKSILNSHYGVIPRPNSKEVQTSLDEMYKEYLKMLDLLSKEGEDSKDMLKSDLRTGHIVKLRQGDILRVLNDTIGVSNEHDLQGVDILQKIGSLAYKSLNDYNEDLTHKSQKRFDIVEVRSFQFANHINDKFEFERLNSLWIRKQESVQYIKAVHFGSTKLYTWVLNLELEDYVKIGDIVIVETSKGNQFVEVKEIYEDLLQEGYKYGLKKVVI